MDMVTDALERVLMLIRIIVPVYAMAMNFVGYTNSALGMYEIILAGVWLVQYVILKFIMPMIKFYVIISLVNNLNREDNFSKLCGLINKLVRWMLKTIVVFIAGLNIIKSLIEPQIDAIGRNTVNRVVSAIPGGGIVSVLTGTFLGAGLIIKNCIGVAGLIFICIFALVPVLKSVLLMLSVKLTGVIIQPVGEKRYVNGVESLAQGMSLLVSALLSSVVLFVLTIAIMAYAGSGG
jgi:stage III sporulation protein AE